MLSIATSGANASRASEYWLRLDVIRASPVTWQARSIRPGIGMPQDDALREHYSRCGVMCAIHRHHGLYPQPKVKSSKSKAARRRARRFASVSSDHVIFFAGASRRARRAVRASPARVFPARPARALVPPRDGFFTLTLRHTRSTSHIRGRLGRTADYAACRGCTTSCTSQSRRCRRPISWPRPFRVLAGSSSR